MSLAVIQTHPVQYYAPVYRYLHSVLGLPTTVIYGVDAGVSGYLDPEFAREVSWDVDLLQGYASVFLGRGAPAAARVAGLRRALARLRPEAVLLTGHSPRFNAMAAAAAVASGLPLLMRSEASDVSHVRSRPKSGLRDLVLRALYRHIRAFAWVGRNAHAHFRRLGVEEERLFFSPMSVPDTHFRPMGEAAACAARVRAALGVDAGARMVLFSGKLGPKKSPQHLLAAAARLPASVREQLVLVFMGDGPLAGELARRAAGAGMPRVRLLGFVNQSRLSEYYHACDLLALPSLYQETWGLVVNEAMMHGKPCLVSDRVGCHGDLVVEGVTGHVHRHGEVDHLAQMLERTLALAARPETARHCLERVADYSTARSARGLLDAFQAVA